MKIRAITRSDFPLIVAKYLETFSLAPWNETHKQETIELYVENLAKMNTFLGFILENEETSEFLGLALGFIKPWYQGEEYMLDTFLIDPSQQTKGIGSQFMLLIKQKLHEQQISGILLDTDKGMPAELFYKKNGFTPVDDAILLFSGTAPNR